VRLGYRVASTWPTSRSTRAQSKNEGETPHETSFRFLSVLGTIKEKPREIYPTHYETDFRDVLFHPTFRMRIVGFHICLLVRSHPPQLAHSMSVNFDSYGTLLTRRKLLLRIS
jgi:hypothetical protein